MLRLHLSVLVLSSCILCMVGSSSSLESAEPQVEPAGKALSCLDEEGNSVDWFIGIKFPRIEDSMFDSGYSYAYFTNKDVNQLDENQSEEIRKKSSADTDYWSFLNRLKNLLVRYSGLSRGKKSEDVNHRGSLKADPKFQWKPSNLLINHSNSSFMRTANLASDLHYNALAYNDDMGNEEKGETDDEDQGYESDGSQGKRKSNNQKRAHAKGILIMDELSDSGVWMSHSVPKFPARGRKIEFPESAHFYGQSFICVTFDLQRSGSNVVRHLLTMRPQTYDTRISETLMTKFPGLRDLGPENSGKRKLFASIEPKSALTISTRGGQTLEIFSKSRNFRQDLYASFIDVDFESSFYVETWRRGRGGPLDSSCPLKGYSTNNVHTLHYNNLTSWDYLNDHSKWAISEGKDKAVVCIADSNRMLSQFDRGGGAICIKCPYCWSVFRNTVETVDSCPGKLKSGYVSKNHSDVDGGFLNRISKMLKF